MQVYVAKIAFMSIGSLKPHEEFSEERVEELLRDMLERGVLIKPIAAESRYGVILDGHHRVEALRRLGVKEVPVALVDYDDERIVVRSWREGFSPSKREVIERALKGSLYPYKTTRHVVVIDGKELHISEVVPNVYYKLKPLLVQG